MTNTQAFAKTELDILNKTVKEPIIAPFYNELLALAEKFGQSGQSGGSAPFTAKAIAQAVEKLLLQEPICPITGIDEEWIDVAHLGPKNGEILYQNKRCSALFKNKDGKSWYLDAISWRNDSGNCWSGRAILPSGERIGISHYIKSFPFTPKTFVIDIREVEEPKDNWEFYLDDVSKLNEVFEYYDRK